MQAVFVARHCSTDWIGRTSSNFVCFELNPLLEPVATGVTRFRFSDYAPHRDHRYGLYWDAMSEGHIGDALGAVAYGRQGQIASLHIGFAERTTDERILNSVHAAGSLVAERLLEFENADTGESPVLSVRERDVLAYVADGNTDWEIGQIMGVAESTARFHVDNARRKLGATNRAHAVARFVAANGLF